MLTEEAAAAVGQLDLLTSITNRFDTLFIINEYLTGMQALVDQGQTMQYDFNIDKLDRLNYGKYSQSRQNGRPQNWPFYQSTKSFLQYLDIKLSRKLDRVLMCKAAKMAGKSIQFQ